MTSLCKLEHYKLLLFFATVVLSACDGTDYSIQTLGQPTSLVGQTPIEGLCSIQREFFNLPKPVLADVVYREKDSRRTLVEFGFMREELPSHYEFALTESAQAWVKMHTHAEISAALMPLVLDQSQGGEAAIVLTSLATNRSFRTKSYNRHAAIMSEDVSKFMADSGYRSPSERGAWGPDKAHAFKLPNEIRVAYLFPGESGNFDENKLSWTETLNEYLNRLQFDMRYYENSLMLSYDPDAFAATDTLDEWSTANPLPPIPEPNKHAKLIALFGKPFVILGSYNGALKRGIAVYELGLHRYWPLLYGQSKSIGELRNPSLKEIEYRDTYAREVQERVFEYSREICGVGS